MELLGLLQQAAMAGLVQEDMIVDVPVVAVLLAVAVVEDEGE
jgi:hypothetical protein